MARRHARPTPEPPPVCHACDSPIEGDPAGHGLLIFPRGDRVVREEPALCVQCAHAIGITALWRWVEEEDGG